jgi:outer membrane protein assembly factor BamB
MKSVSFITLCLVFSIVSAQESTKWRGPTADGIYPETGLLKEWPESGPEILWYNSEIGKGFSSPVFAKGKIYVSGMIDTTGYIFVLNQDGELINKYPFGPEYHISYPGARSSPTIAGDLLYIMSGYGVVTCLDLGSGAITWSKDLLNDFDGINTRWAMTETLVVDGDRVFCTAGGKRYNMVALNRITGGLIWESRGDGKVSAYCTPLLVDFPDGKILFTHTEANIMAVKASSGEKLWTRPYKNRLGIHPNTPIYHKGSLYCFSGAGYGGVMIELNEHGMMVGDKWTNVTLDSKMGGAVLVDGYIYGSGESSRGWKALNWETGEQHYDSTNVGTGAVIYADGMLYCYSQRGELAMVPANPHEFKPAGLAQVRLGSDQHWAHPVINKGRLFIRHGNVLIAYKLK